MEKADFHEGAKAADKLFEAMRRLGATPKKVGQRRKQGK